MTKPISLLRKIIVLMAALPIMVLGIILIPLPGPGLLVCMLSLVILSFEFEAARKYRDKLMAIIRSKMNHR